ncbi:MULTISPECIES: Gfo/Idh/MocA family protein [Listeria]|uniref:Gfo/Idh/MocA family protein n=1 Tax=Listeria TaxID=1637 RepID=UPI000B5909C9|nr:MULTISPECIES: Gfo/Idh/MocA family oxidoreductase [Listeria]
MEKVNLVIVGFGGMGTYHVELAKMSDHVVPVGAYDIDENVHEKIREKGLRVYRSYQEVLADESVHAVLIATPNDVHKKLVIRALESGKHVLCEKPVTLNSEELKEILAVAKKTGRTFMVHQNRRWDQDFLIIKRMLQEKAIGDVFRIESRVQGANGIPGDWRHLKAQGGGMVLDWGVHLLDQLLFMVDSRIKSVSANLSFILGDEVDDGFTSLISFENGVTAHIEVGTTNFIKLPRWYVLGTNGTAVIRDWDMSGEMVIATENLHNSEPTPIQAGQGLTKTMAPPSEEATETVSLPAPLEMETSLYNNFADVILNQAEPIIKNAEVYRVLILIEAIFKAAEENKIIENFDIV